jgi:hypothetical protein
MNDSKFSNGFLLGLLIGGGAVFLLGTKTGRNLLKILSERGMDGLVELLEEYNFEDLGEMDDESSFAEASDGQGAKSQTQESKEVDHQPAEKNPPAGGAAPKKHFFKRFRK